MLGAGLYTGSAVCAELGGDVCAEVRDLDGALLAGFLALFTADTAGGTQLAGHAALIVIGAAHQRHILLGHYLDDAPRARLDAQGAGAALV